MGLLGVNRVVAVEAEDGVEVDEAAFLELGDLGIGKLHPCAVNLCEFVQAAGMAMVVRRHSSGAWAFHTTAAE
jgi:hypothetical protein